LDDKGRLNILLKKNKEVEELVDAMVGDSFWFIVAFFQYNTQVKVNDGVSVMMSKLSEAKIENEEILKRIAFNYFHFFIKICEVYEEKTDKIKKDRIQKNFYDFISQCVFYSIYLAFPKSRHIFNTDFKNSIICLFAYLYNGLTLEKYSIEHWDLDLGTGNIIESDDFYNNKEFKKDCKFIVITIYNS